MDLDDVKRGIDFAVGALVPAHEAFAARVAEISHAEGRALDVALALVAELVRRHPEDTGYVQQQLRLVIAAHREADPS